MSSRHRPGLNGLAGDGPLLPERMGIGEGMEEELQRRMRGRSNNFEEELRSRFGLNNIEEELRNRMGLSNRVGQELNGKMGGNSTGEGDLHNRLSFNRGMEDELRSRMEASHSIEEELRKKIGFSSSIEEELRSRLLYKNSGPNSQGDMSFYNAVDEMCRQPNHPQNQSFQSKNGDRDTEEETEPNSDHLDEVIEAVARNEFDYNPEDNYIKPEHKRSCNQFEDNFPIKQEPIDYDLMAANLTAGLMNPDRRHMCAHCCKGFRSRQQLLQHSLVHTNLRKYHCNYCERSFKQLSHLHQHHRIHTGEKPYSCPLDGCDKAFPQLSNLQHHIRNHDKLAESQYQCHLCDRAYPNEATLKAHNTRMHVHSKLISDLQKSPLSQQPNMSVSPEDTVVSDLQPRQRKRKASRPQHINNRSAIPFNQSEMENRIYNNYMNNYPKDSRPEGYVYILDSDDDENVPDIPLKKSDISSNNNCYSSSVSRSDNFYIAQRSQEGQSKNLSSAEDDDKHFGRINDLSSVRMNNPNFRYLDEDIYRSQMSDTRSHSLPKLSNDMPKNNDHMTESSNEIIRNNSSVSASSNDMFRNNSSEMFRNNPSGSMSSTEMFGHKNQPAISRNGNFLPVSSVNRRDTVPTNGIPINRNHLSTASNEMNRNRDGRSHLANEITRNSSERSQLANEMQHYSSSMGLDLSINNNDFSRMYNERSRLPNMSSDRSYANNHVLSRIQNGLGDNQIKIEGKENQIFTNGMVPAETDTHFIQMMNNNSNEWRRRNFVGQNRIVNGESEGSSDESEVDMGQQQHFPTPNLGADVYDDPMN
ncbi:LIN-29 [Mytilus edulis]|uniref:ZNF362_384 n=1 Tax=Mytilus edulis TaxID=6550 RepID=A0A8S3R907_MYTED|nr:LIN-29 [Mytilus edulis]